MATARKSWLTIAKSEDYLRRHGVDCPNCGHPDVEGGCVEVDAGSAWQKLSCSECDAEWVDIYTLTGVEEN